MTVFNPSNVFVYLFGNENHTNENVLLLTIKIYNMKFIENLAVSILLCSTLVLVSCSQSDSNTDSEANQNHIVLLKFKAQPDKGSMTVSELTRLIEKVKEEPHFISIKLHVDPKDDSNILLYEKWQDLSYYQNEHMNTDHLKDFMTNSSNFLIGPPEVTFWETKKVFK